MAPQRRNPEELPVAALLAPDILVLLDELPADVAAETEEMHPADLADVAELLPSDRLPAFLTALTPARAADVLEYLDEELRTEVLEQMTARDAAALVSEMTPDDRADTLDHIDEDLAANILSEIPTEARRETEDLLRYDPDTAGGLMTTEFVSAPAETTADAALQGVRAVARTGRREAMYVIYTTDVEGRLRGVLSLRELLAAAPGVPLSELASTEVRTVLPSADREEVARLTSDYDLVAVPVVSESGHLMGVVTVDDVIDAIQEEQTEDIQKLGGMEALDEPYTQISFGRMIRKRAGWLMALFIGEMLTATAMGRYQIEIDRLTLLAVFVPLIISSGGNSGSQATSLIIRALALREVSLREWWRILLRELPAGITLGCILAIIGVVRISVWQQLGWYDYGEHWMLIAATVGVSLVGVVTFGSLAGSMLPFALKRVGLDPASASAPFVATLVDVTGLVIYFTVAAAILGKVLAAGA